MPEFEYIDFDREIWFPCERVVEEMDVLAVVGVQAYSISCAVWVFIVYAYASGVAT